MPLVSISEFSSLNFRKDWKLSFQQNVDYTPKFLPSDLIQVQYTLFADSISPYLTNLKTQNTNTLSPVLIEEGKGYKSYQLTIDNSTITEDTAFNLYFYSSELGRIADIDANFCVCMELPGTILLEYTNRRNDKDTIFSGIDKFRFRVEGAFLPQENTFENESESFRDQRYFSKVLSSFTYEKQTLSLGGGYGVPNWVARKINLIFSLSSVFVDGKPMTRSEGSSVEINILHNDYPLYIYKIVLEETEETSDSEQSINYLRAVDEKKKIVRSSSDDDLRAYALDTPYLETARMIRELSFISDLAENYVIEIDDNASDSSRKVSLGMLIKFMSGYFFSEEKLGIYLSNNKFATQSWVLDALQLYPSKEWLESNYLKQEDFNDMFELVTATDGSKLIKAKYSLYSVGALAAYGIGDGGEGGGPSGAITLGGLSNVGNWADLIPDETRVMIQEKGSQNWSSMLLSDISGLKSVHWSDILGKPNLAILNYSGYWGLSSDPDGNTDSWIRTPASGLLPYAIDSINGISDIGSSVWPFREAHIKNIIGNASTSSRWQSPVSIYINGDVNGSFSIDGSGNVNTTLLTSGYESIPVDWADNFRKYLFGSTDEGSFFKTFRTNDRTGGLSIHSSSIGWGIADTHAYINVAYSAPEAYIGGGNAGVIQWFRKIAFEETVRYWLDNDYLPLNGGTMRGALNFPNGTWNLVGDDVYIGDCNVPGMLGIRAANTPNPGIAFYHQDDGAAGQLSVDGTTLKWDSQIIWHSGNDGPGSGLDADLLDGLHRSNLYQGIDEWFLNTDNLHATIDLSASSYDQDTFYPVLGAYIPGQGLQFIKVDVHLNSGTVPKWSTHAAGFTVNMEIWVNSSGWGTTNEETYATIYSFLYCDKNPSGFTQMHRASRPVLWLRGGGRYFVKTGYICEWEIKTTPYTEYDETVSPQSGGEAPFTFNKTKLYADLEGNAATATRIAWPVSIWGNSFDGFSDITGAIRWDKNTDFAKIDFESSGNADSWLSFHIGDDGSIPTIGFKWFCNHFVNGDYELMRLGADGNLTMYGNIIATGAVNAYSTSDRRLKENISDLKGCSSDKLRLLRPVEFDWTEEAMQLNPHQHPHDMSFIADEYEMVLPFAIGRTYDKFLGIDRNVLYSILVGGWQEHDDEIISLKERVFSLEIEVKQLKLQNNGKVAND